MSEEFIPLVPYWYNIGDTVNGLEIIKQTYVVNKKGWKSKAYIVKCIKCGYVYQTPKRESNLKKYGCVVCNGKKVVAGINDIATVMPWMVDYLENKEDAKLYTYRSNKMLPMKCPYCNKDKKKLTPNTLYRNGYGCSCCGDGLSYPEKFLRHLLDYINIDYICQLSKNNYPWCNGYRYDFYIPSKNIIIETNGIQHYEDACFTNYKDQEKIDKEKEKLALKNGISKYIQLDCRESNLEWVKNSILNSELYDIFNLGKIDINWIEIEKKALKSNIFLACKLWEENKSFTTDDIGKQMHLCGATIQKYLKKGSKIGICNYNSEISDNRRILKILNNPPTNAKKIFYKDKIFKSIGEYSDFIDQSRMTVGRWLSGKAVPRDKKKMEFLLAHYATPEEIKIYPKYNKI